MARYKLVIAYDGTPYVGWQRQANGRTVQAEIEGAIARISGAAHRVQCAGRTDTGVHATGQVAHVDLDRGWRTDRLRDAINAHLKPQPIAILSAEPVPDGFDARRSALARHYRYRILNRRAPPTLERNAVWHVPWRIDAGLMDEAAQILVGRHDFTTFRASECQAASPIRTLDRLSVRRDGEEIVVAASARAFLHSQVRSMVGTVAQAGAERWSLDAVRKSLVACRRSACGPLAPPQGLALVRVDYPALPDQDIGHRGDREVEPQAERGQGSR